MELPSVRFVVAVRRHVVGGNDQIVFLKTEIHLLSITQTANKEAGTCESDDRQGDLKKDQEVPHVEGPGRSKCARPFFQFRNQIRIRGTQRRKQPKYDSAKH